MIAKLVEHIDKELFIQSLHREVSNCEQTIVDLFVSNSCNLHCRHCYFLNYQPQAIPLSLEKWKDIIDDCIRVGIKHFHFSGKEPFCDSRVPELLDYLNHLAQTRSLKYGLVTNGTKLTSNELQKIVNSNLSYLEFSLEGGPNYNLNIRKSNSFECIYNLINTLRDTSKINITSTYFGDNLFELEGMIDEFRKIGIMKFNIAPYMKFVDTVLSPVKQLDIHKMIDLINHFRNYLEASRHEAIDIRICLSKEQAYEMFRNENCLTHDIKRYIYYGERMIYQIRKSILEISFPLLYIPFLKQMIITTDGLVIPCADDIHYKNIDEISIGSIRDESMESIMSKRKEYIFSHVNNYLQTR